MQMDEQLIALVTQKVLEALGQNAPAANEAETPEGAVKGIQGPPCSFRKRRRQARLHA